MSIIPDVLGGLYATADQDMINRINQIRNSINGGGISKNLNEETMQYYLDQRKLGLGFIALSSTTNTILEQQNKNYWKKTTNYSASIQENSGVVAGTRVEPTTNPDMTETPSLPEVNRTQPTSADNFGEREALQEKTSKYFEDNNSSIYKPGLENTSGQFGELGEPVLKNEVIGMNLLNFVQTDSPQGNNKPPLKVTRGWLNPDATINLASFGTPEEEYSVKRAAAVERQAKILPGSFKFFIEKLHGRDYAQNKVYKKNPISIGKTAADLPNRMVFPAYITTYNDSYSASFSDYNFIGRGESVYSYQKTSRKLTLEFMLLSDFSADIIVNSVTQVKNLVSSEGGSLNGVSSSLVNTSNMSAYELNQIINKQVNLEQLYKQYRASFPDWGYGTTPVPVYNADGRTGFVPSFFSGTPEMLWHRKTFLAQCLYPWYRKDGKMKEQPLVRIRVGDFLDVIGIVENLNFNSDGFEMDLNNPTGAIGEIPLALKVTMSIAIIHEEEASSESYKFYHRHDEDDISGLEKYAASSTNEFFDGVLNNYAAGSPISQVGQLGGNSGLGMSNAQIIALETATKLQKDIKGLKLSKSSLNDVMKGQKLQSLLNNSVKLLAVKSFMEAGVIQSLKKGTPESMLANTATSVVQNGTGAINVALDGAFIEKKVPKTTKPTEKKVIFPQFKDKPNSSF